MTRPLIEIMREAWAAAITEGRHPRRWEINEAAKTQLKHEQKALTVDFPRPQDDAFMAPIFGIPVLKIWETTDDPRFNLIVDEREKHSPLGFDARITPFDAPPVILKMNAGTPSIDDCFYGQLISQAGNVDRTTPTQVGMIIDELRRRSVDEPGISDAERAHRKRLWDSNPPCDKCGSYDHFEC